MALIRDSFCEGVTVWSTCIDKYVLSKNIEWIIHSIYGVKKFHSLRSEFHSILTPVEWKFTTQRVESRPVHSIFTPKKWSVTKRVKIHSIILREYNYMQMWLISYHFINILSFFSLFSFIIINFPFSFLHAFICNTTQLNTKHTWNE